MTHVAITVTEDMRTAFVAAKSMAKAERDDALNTLVCNLCCAGGERYLIVEQASRLFAAMLDDIVVDVAVQSHQEVARSRRKCDVCYTQCVLSRRAAFSSLARPHFALLTFTRSCRQGDVSPLPVLLLMQPC